MSHHRGSPAAPPTHSAGRNWLACLALSLPVLNSGQVRAEVPVPGQAAPPAGSIRVLTLPECRELALQHQPRVAARRASLAVAEDGRRGLEALRILLLLDREIPIRVKQAELGVAAASAGLEQAERDALYAVTRTYFTVQFAREQERVAAHVVSRLSRAQGVVQEALASNVRGVTANDLNRTTVYLRLAETRRVQAAQGVKRGLAALKEAIGLAPDCRIDVPAAPLPLPAANLCLGNVVAASLASRGTLLQANLFAEVACLEVDAQAANLFKRVDTFAAGADIHARDVSESSHNTDYHPGGIPPEMPTLLVGPRKERVQRSQSLSARAQSASEVARNLIALQAEDAFFRWEEAAAQIPAAREAAQAGAHLADDLDKDLGSGIAGSRLRLEDVVNAQVLGSQAQAQFNEILYRHLLALLELDRLTAGAICVQFADAAVPQPLPAPAPADGGK